MQTLKVSMPLHCKEEQLKLILQIISCFSNNQSLTLRNVFTISLFADVHAAS